MGLFSRKKKPRERVIRSDYDSLPQDEWTDDEYDHWTSTISEEEYWEHWEKWSKEAVEHPRVKNVKKGMLQMACEAARSSHPQEFGCMLKVEGDTITELVLIPGTIQGDRHAIFQMHMLPVDRTIKGTLHSHPSPHPYPSDADFELFEHHGMIHIIVGTPYTMKDWRAYDHRGKPTKLTVVP